MINIIIKFKTKCLSVCGCLIEKGPGMDMKMYKKASIGLCDKSLVTTIFRPY